MEYEVVEIKVPKGMFSESVQLMIVDPRDKLRDDDDVFCYLQPRDGKNDRWQCFTRLLIARGKALKPAWNPPKLKKGFVTWDEACGWYWWENRPEYHAVDFWSYPQSGDVFENEEIGSMMAEILGCPCCDGFDERNCIWEVGQ